MSRASTPSPNTSLTPEQEALPIEAATSIDWSTDWPREAQQAIGQLFSITTADAEPIFNELLRRRSIEARPEPGTARNFDEPGFERANMRAKYYRSGAIADDSKS
jgi:hypothetical protein